MPTLFLIVFIDLVGFGLVIPLLPFYALRFGAPPQEVTLLLAIYSLMQLFAAPLWGRLSDRVGRRPVLMISMAASVLAYLWIGSATAMWMLFTARSRRCLRRQYRRGAGLYRRHYKARGTSQGNGPDRCCVRFGVHHRSCPWRAPGRQ